MCGSSISSVGTLSTLLQKQLHINMDAIQENLITPELSVKQMSLVYANEADVLQLVRRFNLE